MNRWYPRMPPTRSMENSRPRVMSQMRRAAAAAPRVWVTGTPPTLSLRHDPAWTRPVEPPRPGRRTTQHSWPALLGEVPGRRCRSPAGGPRAGPASGGATVGSPDGVPLSHPPSGRRQSLRVRARRSGHHRGRARQGCATQRGIPRASRRGSPQRAGSFGAQEARPTRLLGRDAGATLAATCCEHGTTCPGAHPGAEPVRAGAPTVVRLESALHDVSSLRLGVPGRRALGMCTPAGRTSSWVLRYASA